MNETQRLQEELAQLAAEVQRARSELRTLRQNSRKQSAARKVLYAATLVIAILTSGLLISPETSALSSSAQRPVTRLEAPVIIVGKSGNSIVEISENPGLYGLTLYDSKGGGIALGIEKESSAGLIQIRGPGNKKVARIGDGGFYAYTTSSDAGFYAYNSSGKASAGMGATPNAAGYLTLGNQNGDGVVESGMTQDGRGFVKVYPIGGPVPQVIPKFLMGGKR